MGLLDSLHSAVLAPLVLLPPSPPPAAFSGDSCVMGWVPCTCTIQYTIYLSTTSRESCLEGLHVRHTTKECTFFDTTSTPCMCKAACNVDFDHIPLTTSPPSPPTPTFPIFFGFFLKKQQKWSAICHRVHVVRVFNE